MFCKKCGNQIPDDINFCSNCGTPVSRPVTQQTQAPVMQAPPAQPVTQQRPVTQAPPAQSVTQQRAAQPPKEFLTAATTQGAPSAPATNTFAGKKTEPPKEYIQGKAPDAAPSGANQQAPMAGPAPDGNAKTKKAKKPKKNIGMKIIAIILVFAVLATGGLFLADFFAHKKQMEGKEYVGLGEFPVLKQETEFTVYDANKFPVDEYEIKVEELKGGGILRSNTFVNSKKPILQEISRNRIFDLRFPSDGNYRITLTEIDSERTRPASTTTTIKTTIDTTTGTTTSTTTTTTTTATDPTTKDENVIVIVIVIDVKVDNDDPEAVDKVDLNSRADEETTATTAAPQLNESLAATEADFVEFGKMVAGMMPNQVVEFNCRASNTQYIMENFVTDLTGIPGYKYFFNDASSKDVESEGTDPLKWWQVGVADGVDTYWILDENNVKWICENIFHIKYDPSFSSDFIYSHNGHVYKGDLPVGGDGWKSVTVKSHIQQGDKYVIKVEFVSANDESAQIYEFAADIWMMNGKRQWTIYEIARADAPEPETSTSIVTQAPEKPDIEATDADLKKLSDILLAFNYAEYDSASVTTAYAVENILTNSISSYGYDYFYHDIVKKPTSSDPLNKFGTAYMAMDADNVKWICENVLNISFDPSYSSTDSYVHNGKVYRKAISAAEQENYFASLKTSQIKNKRYVIGAEFYSTPANQTLADGNAKLIGSYEVVAVLKNVNGSRVWTIYSISRK